MEFSDVCFADFASKFAADVQAIHMSYKALLDIKIIKYGIFVVCYGHHWRFKLKSEVKTMY